MPVTEQLVSVHVPARHVPAVTRFLSLLGFAPEPDAGSEQAEETSYLCNGLKLHLSTSLLPDSAQAPIAFSLPVRDQGEVAARCWSDGYTVEAEELAGEEVQLTMVGPCGLRVTLECVEA